MKFPPALSEGKPTPVTQFDRDTSPEVVEGGFSIRLSERWMGVGGIHGGYLAAILLRTITTSIADASHEAVTLDVQYFAPARPGEALLATHRERIGRSVAIVSARLLQGSREIALAVACFTRPREEHLNFCDVPLPLETGPESVPVIGRDALGLAPWAENFEMRPCLGGIPFGSSLTALSGGWIRLLEDRPIDTVLLAALPDAWMPSIRTRLNRPYGPDSTIKIGMHFSGLSSMNPADRNGFCFLQSQALIAQSGYWQEDATVWTRSGLVVVRSRQVAIGA